MATTSVDGALEVFSMCPTINNLDPDSYLRQAINVARWSEECGCRGILVFSDNSQLDAWTVSQLIISHTYKLCPLVAVQPVYMHPYTVAKILSTTGWLYARQIYLNMVAGGFVNDLKALDDRTPHDKRYDRLSEYVHIVRSLLEGQTVTFDGEFYHVDKLKLAPPLAEELFPGIFVSGSSDAGVAAARTMGATAIKYPKPAGEEEARAEAGLVCGIRVGIIARRSRSEAWDIAHLRFPEDRKGQLTRQLASKVSDSVWHKELNSVDQAGEESPYWLVPFQNYKAMCPYLVGSYEQVGVELARYFRAGHRTVILEAPTSLDDMRHMFTALEAATQGVGVRVG